MMGFLLIEILSLCSVSWYRFKDTHPHTHVFTHMLHREIPHLFGDQTPYNINALKYNRICRLVPRSPLGGKYQTWSPRREAAAGPHPVDCVETTEEKPGSVLRADSRAGSRKMTRALCGPCSGLAPWVAGNMEPVTSTRGYLISFALHQNVGVCTECFQIAPEMIKLQVQR